LTTTAGASTAPMIPIAGPLPFTPLLIGICLATLFLFLLCVVLVQRHWFANRSGVIRHQKLINEVADDHLIQV